MPDRAWDLLTRFLSERLAGRQRVHDSGRKTVDIDGTDPDSVCGRERRPLQGGGEEQLRPLSSASRLEKSLIAVKDGMLQDVVAQRGLIEGLLQCFRESFLEGPSGAYPRMVLFIQGPRSTGRQYVVDRLAHHFFETGLIASPRIGVLDLGQYVASPDLPVSFTNELYRSLYGDNEIVVMRNFEQAAATVMNSLRRLLAAGSIRITQPRRAGSAPDSQGMLYTGTLEELSANGKSFIFITEAPLNRIKNVFGDDYLPWEDCLLTADPLSSSDLIDLAARMLLGIAADFMEKSSVTINMDQGLAAGIAGMCDNREGAAGVKSKVIRLIKEPCLDLLGKGVLREDAVYRIEKRGAGIVISGGELFCEIKPRSNDGANT